MAASKLNAIEFWCLLPLSALQFLRGRRDVEAEVEDLVVEVIVEQLQCRMSVLSLLAQSFLRWQIVIIVVLNLGQQLSGVNAVRHHSF